MRLAGFFFLFILVLTVAMAVLGKLQIEIGKHDIGTKLKKIHDASSKFKLSIVVALIAHISIIVLAILLFYCFWSI